MTNSVKFATDSNLPNDLDIWNEMEEEEAIYYMTKHQIMMTFLLTLSFANSNCLTTTISANNNTRVTEPSSVRAALTIGPRSSSCA